jgi:hypothetical protein
MRGWRGSLGCHESLCTRRAWLVSSAYGNSGRRRWLWPMSPTPRSTPPGWPTCPQPLGNRGAAPRPRCHLRRGHLARPHRRRPQRHGLPAQPGHRSARPGGAGQPRRRATPTRPRPTPTPRHPRDRPRMRPISRHNDGALTEQGQRHRTPCHSRPGSTSDSLPRGRTSSIWSR